MSDDPKEIVVSLASPIWDGMLFAFGACVGVSAFLTILALVVKVPG